MMEEIDMERSRGEINASVEELLQRNFEVEGADAKQRTHLMRWKSCIINLCNAFVGCVMYTFPFPSLKLVCDSGQYAVHETKQDGRAFSVMYVSAAA